MGLSGTGARIGAIAVLAALPPMRAADRDVVINEIMYHPAVSASRPGDELKYEYIELYNAGSEAADVSGCAFTRGIRYTIPDGTVIPPDGYLVIARDEEAVEEKYALDPARVVGGTGAGDETDPFQGNLRNRGERIILESRVGETIEDLTYSDLPPYPVLADGFGSSLERVNPRVDSDLPGNWGALPSRGWRRATARGTARGDLFFHIPKSARILIDDVSLIEEGEARNRVLNPDFEDGILQWAPTGNHRARAYTRDAHAGSGSMQIYTSGSAQGDDMVSTPFWPPLEEGRTYELSFWYTKSSGTGNLLEVGFTEGGMAARLVLEGGTPGGRNAVYREDLPPVFMEVARDPRRATPEDAVLFQARVLDLEGRVEAVTLSYDAGEGEVEIPLEDDGAHDDGLAGDGIYGGAIPPQENLAIVRYRLRAVDDAGGESWFPRQTEPTTRHGYFVYDGSIETKIPILWFFIASTDLSRLATSPKSLVPGTLCFDGEAYDCLPRTENGIVQQAGFRYRGQSAINTPKRHWHIEFPKDRRFPPSASPESLSGGGFGQWRMDINVNSLWGNKDYLRHPLAYKIFEDFGHPSCYQEHVRVELYDGSRQAGFYGLYFHFEHPDEAYLRRNAVYGIDAGGDLYKAYAQAESRGTSPSSYMGSYEKKTNRATGYDDLARFLSEINATPASQIESYIGRNMDVGLFNDYLVLTCLIQNIDHPAKNYFLYQDPEDDPDGDGLGRWTMLPWDLDLALGRNYECGGGGVYNDVIRWNNHILMGTAAHPKCDGPWNRVINKFLTTPSYLQMYYDRIRYLLRFEYLDDTYYPVIDAWQEKIEGVAEMDRARWRSYGSPSTWDYKARIQELRAWFPKRRDFLLGYFLDPPQDLSCALDGGDVLAMSWTNTGGYSSIEVRIGGATGKRIARLGGREEQYTSNPLRYTGEQTVCLLARSAQGQADPVCCTVTFPLAPPVTELECARTTAGDGAGRTPAVHLTWTAWAAYDRLEIVREIDGAWQTAGEVAGGAREATVALAPEDAGKTGLRLGVVAAAGGESSEPVVCQLDLTPPPMTVADCFVLGSQAVVSWGAAGLAAGYEGLEVLLDGEKIAELPPDANHHTLTDLDCAGNPHHVELRGVWFGIASEPAACDLEIEDCGPRFVRGDVDSDGAVAFADAPPLLEYLFLGGAPPICPAAADANGDGRLAINDAVFLLRFALTGSAPPPAPFPDCGIAGGPLGCSAFPPCE